MADEKKPKIDLKTRLKKMGGTAVAAADSSGAAIPAPTKSSVPGPTPIPPPAIPIPPGLPGFGSSRPPAQIDPNNPLAAVAVPFRPQTQPPAAPAQPQRIEVDEGAVQQARAGMRNLMLIVAVVLAGVGVGIGYLVGTGSAKTGQHTQSVNDVKSVGKDLSTVGQQLQDLASKVSDGKSALDKSQFPADLDKALNGISIDFTGDKLAGKNTAALTSDIAHDLFDFITRVQQLTSKKSALANNLSKNQKAVNDWFGYKGNPPFTNAIIIDRDGVNNGAVFAPFGTPLQVPTDKPLPDKFTLVNNKANVDVSRYTGAELKDRVALAISPGAEATICGANASTQNVVKSLQSDMTSLLNDILAQQSDDPSQPQGKTGLKDLATSLVDRLNKVN
jgi:hypothetical protein